MLPCDAERHYSALPHFSDTHIRISSESKHDGRPDPNFEFLSFSEKSIQEEVTVCGAVKNTLKEVAKQ
jgi:hypothetical protein